MLSIFISAIFYYMYMKSVILNMDNYKVEISIHSEKNVAFVPHAVMSNIQPRCNT